MKKLLTTGILGFSFALWSCKDAAEETGGGGEGDAHAPAPAESMEDTAEKLANDTGKVIEKVTVVIKDVNEGADPDKAIEEIKGMKDDLVALSDRTKKMIEEEFEGDREAFQKKMQELSESEMAETMEAYGKEMSKLYQSGEEEAKKFATELQKEMSALDY